ncbi:hypothetical protein GCM10007049_25380 [Echinicola pacifica]|uniref:ASPIC/UnbV domain-containing protein n=1 Tax=Echinicola pacifica TaxID=346377 RepID=A0A918Q3V8_9BACT|nr:VCBS repeat-containing protein [Echinicola pacifica]GGZ31274.1 hypothetical protein GCM10007049_25380 [Echinicola pacifica]
MPKNLLISSLILINSLIYIGCETPDAAPEPKAPLFTIVDPSVTGVDFSNTLTESPEANIFQYQYFYNGGGVAIGDVNNDGLEDLYFSGNMSNNKLYLNRGSLQFQDISLASNVSGRPRSWATGVAMVDINQDGWMDIYVCYSGDLAEEQRRNQLFVNQGADAQGIPYFKEMAEEYGLDNAAYSSAAAFFDHDADGDLDMVLLNHHPQLFRNLDEVSFQHILAQKDPNSSSRLLENRSGIFVDITEEAGWDTSPLSYGLGMSISDFDGDGLPEVYIGNDYSAADHLYQKQEDGTYREVLAQRLDHTSLYTMGMDAADYNNDGKVDLLSLDMLPEDNKRQKLLFMPDNYSHFNLFLSVGLHYQYMRNMLQVNNGDGTFSELGQVAGISNTDWSWAPLWADFDQDGWKDLFISNGFLHDFTNLDFIKYRSSFFQNGKMSTENLMTLIHEMPSSAVTNYIYQNNADLTFTNQQQNWGFDRASNSNGAAYADLDNDGDLDLVINNINEEAFIYENHRNESPNHHWLKIHLQGPKGNLQGIGSQVRLYQRGTEQLMEQMPYRGYQSSVSPILTFGLSAAEVDSVLVTWPDGATQCLVSPRTSQSLILNHAAADKPVKDQTAAPSTPLWVENKEGNILIQKEETFNDFKRQPLLTYPLSDIGPVMASSSGQGEVMVYIGAGMGARPLLFRGISGEELKETVQRAFQNSSRSVDTDAVFFDADGDGDRDLYVASGGYHDFSASDVRLQDRFYENMGGGIMEERPLAIPERHAATGAVLALDANADGALDLFIGGAAIPGRHPESYPSQLLINDGKGHFSLASPRMSSALEGLHLVRDAQSADLDGDGIPEMVVAGEWMGLEVFSFQEGKVLRQTDLYFDHSYAGIWFSLLLEDMNGDGEPELLAGNFGLNSQIKASREEPARLSFGDFDGNGSVDPFLNFYIQTKEYPYISRDELMDQISAKRNSFKDYASYAEAKLEDILSDSEQAIALTYEVNTLETMLFTLKDGRFVALDLPMQAQIAPVYTAAFIPSPKGNYLWLGGNIHQGRIKIGNIDANHGLLMELSPSLESHYIPQDQSGFCLRGEVRSSLWLGDVLWLGEHQGPIRHYAMKK